MGEARPLAEVYRRVAGVGVLHDHVAATLGRSAEAMQVLATLPARRRHPALVLAALHDLALAGRAPALAAAYTSGDAEAAGRAAVHTLLTSTEAVVGLVTRRQVRADGTGHHAVLYPAVAEAAHRVDATAVGLVDVGSPAGLDLGVDRVGITYGDGPPLGDPSSPVQVSCRLVGDRPVPSRPMPDVVARVLLDIDPLDISDPDDVRWLRACVPPDQPARAARLDAEIALAAGSPPRLLRGDIVDRLPEALAAVPVDALPVVTTTWTLSRLSPERRRQFRQQLGGAGRPVAWVSAEGVGVAPSVPTLGDRPASGHSILGLVLVDGTAARAEALGRCWSRGQVLAWLAGAQAGSSSVA